MSHRSEHFLVALNATNPAYTNKSVKILFVINAGVFSGYDLRPYKDEIVLAIEKCPFFKAWFGKRGTLWTRQTLEMSDESIHYHMHYAEFWGRIGLDPVWLLRLPLKQLSWYAKFCKEEPIVSRIKKELFRREVEGEYTSSEK